MVEAKDKSIYPERTWLMVSTAPIPVPRLIGIDGLGALFEALVADGYRVIGPAVQDGAIVLRELSSAAELPAGWGVRLMVMPGCAHALRDARPSPIRKHHLLWR
jgi:hypothetical protein